MNSFICREDYPLVETDKGVIRGFEEDGLLNFLGITYAHAERFKAPVPVEKWDGIKDAISYGYTCRVLNVSNPESSVNHPHNYWPESEDCMNLNVWTDSLDPDTKKPVMVWLHGGGFQNGSAIEMKAYVGANLAREKDVVLVSVNHRLNVLGYLDLSAYGPEFSASGIAGQQDLVEALKWVKANIAQFGGDPENVTIFGQSGGGGKVLALMQMPSAKGLFHKAVVMSGSLGCVGPRGEKQEALAVAKELVDLVGGIDKLQTCPYYEIAEAVDKMRQNKRVDWAPVPGCGDFNGLWDDPVGFAECSKDIPVLIGTVFAEFEDFTGSRAWFDKGSLTHEEVKKYAEEKYGSHAEEMMEEFERAYPELKPYYVTKMDTVCRKPVLDYVNRRAEFTDAPCFTYVIAFESEFKGGTMCVHADELCYLFRNAEIRGVAQIGTRIDKLEDELSGAWTSFARNGSPACKELPDWKNYTKGHPFTYVIGDVSSQRLDFDRVLIEKVGKYAEMPGFFKAGLK